MPEHEERDGVVMEKQWFYSRKREDPSPGVSQIGLALDRSGDGAIDYGYFCLNLIGVITRQLDSCRFGE